MLNIALVFLGGGLGSVLRMLVGLALNQTFPWGTLTVNLAGCFLIGLAAEIFSRMTSLDPSLRFFFITGILGGFTTYSSFSQESFSMIQKGEAAGFYYIGVTVIGGLACNYGGWKVGTLLK